MNTKEIYIAISWILWSIAYYAYYPFISIYLSEFTDAIAEVYMIAQLSSFLFIALGIYLEKIGISLRNLIILGMFLSGIGLIMLSYSHSFILATLSLVLNYSFYLSLPSFYYYMSYVGKGIIAKVWGLSIFPSFIMPAIGGLISQYFGFKTLFIISGLVLSLSASPVLRLDDISVKEDRFRVDIKKLVPLLFVLPVALISPYIFLEVKELYGLSNAIVGIIADIAEILGISLLLLAPRLIKDFKKLLMLSLLIFSVTALIYISPYFAIFYGSWEAIIPLSLEFFSQDNNSYTQYSYILVSQGIGWELGYIMDTLFRANMAIISGCLISLFDIVLLFIIRSNT